MHWFNGNRLHSSIGYLTPIEYEELYYREINSPTTTAAGTPRPPQDPGRFTRTLAPNTYHASWPYLRPTSTIHRNRQ